MFLRNQKDAYHLGLFARQSLGLLPTTIDSNGNTSYSGKNTTFSGQSGFLFHLDAGSSNDKNVTIRLYSDVSFSYVYGNYNQAMNLTDFSIIHLKAGCVIGDLFNFNASGPLYCTTKSIQSIPFTISIQFSPSQVAQATQN